MILFDLDDLATRLRDDAISEREKLNYLLLLVAVSFFTGSASLFAVLRRPILLLVYFFLLMVYLIGVILCYDVNRRGDDRSFTERFIILGAPILLRMYLMSSVIWWVIRVGAGPYSFARMGIVGWLTMTAGLELITYAAGFYWMREAIEIASSGPRRTSAVLHATNHSMKTTTHGDPQ